MDGIKILQEASHDNAKIVQIIGQLVNAEIINRDLAIRSNDGYHKVGEYVVDDDGTVLKIILIHDGNATIKDTNGKTYSISINGGTAWRLKGLSNE